MGEDPSRWRIGRQKAYRFAGGEELQAVEQKWAALLSVQQRPIAAQIKFSIDPESDVVAFLNTVVVARK